MYVPIHCHGYFSALDGLSSPQALARRAVRLGLPGIALTDHGVVAGVPSFLRALKEACKVCGHPKSAHADGGKGRCLVRGEACGGYEPASLRPAVGCEMYVCEPAEVVKDGNVVVADPSVKDSAHRRLNHLVVLAKNRDGWRRLLKAVSEANAPENFYYKPRLNVERLGERAGGQWVAFSGHPGSALANTCFADPKAAYRADTVEEARSFLKDREWLRRDLVSLATHYRDLFGKDNFFVEVQLTDAANMPAAMVVAQCMRRVADLTGIPCVGTPDAHYPDPTDAEDQRVLLCGSLCTTLRKVRERAAAGEDVTLGGFFRSDRYHVPTPAEMGGLHADQPDELANSLRIHEMCEPFDLTNPPQLPNFPCPDGLNSHQYLRRLCEDGFKAKVEGKRGPGLWGEYRSRLETELRVFEEANISSYFLVGWDLMKYAVERLGCPIPDGRGSGAGCLTGYLLGMADADPVKGKLFFERFYNAGRNAPGRISLPDYDFDFPVGKRDRVVAYLRERYGQDRVAQIATFQTLHGREALKLVFRAHEWGSFDERNVVTSRLPPPDAISDKLQEMREGEGYSSSITWAVRHHPEDYADWVTLSPEGEWGGPLGPLFAQAVRLEGCKRGDGRHASGVIVAPEPLENFCPMIYDKATRRVKAGMEYEDLEAAGLLKLDCLGINALDKLSNLWETVRTGRVPAAHAEDDPADTPDPGD